jgi:C1A family cysteine protease
MARQYGWRRQAPDPRDFQFRPPERRLATLPASFSLLQGMPPPNDQGDIGSCGPNSADHMIRFAQNAAGAFASGSSRLLTYYATRQLMGTLNQDSGVDNRTMLKALAKVGFCDETLWPYDVRLYRTKPPQQAYAAALPNAITNYAVVEQRLEAMKQCLVAGHPFLFGFDVFEAYEGSAARTGIVPMPSARERPIGGHDNVIFGYDDASQMFDIQNCWGRTWGIGGRGKIPYAYATNPDLAGDFWVINALPGHVVPPAPDPLPPPKPNGGSEITIIIKDAASISIPGYTVTRNP